MPIPGTYRLSCITNHRIVTKAWTFIVPLNLCHSVVIDWQEQEKGNIDTRHCSLCTTHLMNGNRKLLPSNSLPECRKYCLFKILERDRQWCTWRHHYPIMSAAHVVHRQSSAWLLLISHPWKGGFYFLFKVKFLDERKIRRYLKSLYFNTKATSVHYRRILSSEEFPDETSFWRMAECRTTRSSVYTLGPSASEC